MSEIEKLRGLLRDHARQLRKWAAESRNGGWSTHQVDPMMAAAERIDDALSQQAEPAQAQFCDDVAHDDWRRDGFPCPACTKKPATAQDERADFEAYMLGREHPVIGWISEHWFKRGDDPTTYANDYVQGAWVLWQSRPAQTEQQPAFLLEIGSDGEYAVLVRDKSWLRAMRNKREYQEHKLYTAPIAQTAPQPEQSGLVDMVRLALHNGQLVPDPEMDGSTEVFGIKIDDMEALEAVLSAQGESHE